MNNYRSGVGDRIVSVWRQALGLAWPVMIDKLLRTFMRTTDVLVAGLFSPAAVSAVGLGDIFSGILTHAGLGIGDAAIALTSQDTGRGAVEDRNEAVTQAIVIGLLAGVPLAVFGALFSYAAIAVLGAEREIVRMGGEYLFVIMLFAPMSHLSYVGARAIQGTGDTRTPMYVNSVSNVLNISGTLVLAFGLGPFPRLTIVGIALATALGETLSALLYLGIIYLPMNELRLVRPRNLTITKQLLVLSLPRFVEGLSKKAVAFPFNAILFVFGTEVNAAYHIARRLYKQVLVPFTSSFSVAANILVGRALGERNPKTAYNNGVSTALLGIAIVGSLGVVLFAAAPRTVGIFIDDSVTIRFGIDFLRAFAVSSVFIAGFFVCAGSLRGGSDTRSPLVATFIGSFVFLLGTSYIGGIHLEYGAVAACVGIVADFVWRSVFVGVVYHRQNWVMYGSALMDERRAAKATSDGHEK